MTQQQLSTEMSKQEKLDRFYMDIAERTALMSQARRLKVGSCLVKDNNIISYGWNGMPAGMDNNCEHENADGTLTTKAEVIHSECNLYMKLVRQGGIGTAGATLYTTYSPCPQCALLVKSSDTSRVVYRHNYRLLDGIEMLRKLNIPVDQLK